MSVKLLTEHHLEFLSLKGGCTGLSESSLVKMPYCWKTIYMMEISCRDSCVLIICMMGILSCYCNMLNFFIEFFQEHYQCQTACIKIRTDYLWILFWVQTVCKGHQLTTKISDGKQLTICMLCNFPCFFVGWFKSSGMSKLFQSQSKSKLFVWTTSTSLRLY